MRLQGDQVNKHMPYPTLCHITWLLHGLVENQIGPTFCRILPRYVMLIISMAAACWQSLSPSIAQEVPLAVHAAEQQRVKIMARASSATVSVYDGTGQGGGSGVVISPDGFALTNFHVTSPAGSFMKCSLPDGQIYSAVIVGLDPTGDVALIRLLGRNDFPTATLGDSTKVRVGDWCFAVGNPFLLATDFQPTVSYGLVSGINRYQHPAGTLLEYTDCIQTDASINPGNSGGPLFNSEGQLIGVNGRISVEKRGRVNVGVGYAISMQQIQNFMGYLRSGRIVDHATLGASLSTDDKGRVVVTNILGSSDAYRRGLRHGDEIIRFAGRPIRSVNAFKNALGTLPKGWRVPLTYSRNGKDTGCLVRLSGVHRYEELLAKAVAGNTSPHKPDGDGPHPQKPKSQNERSSPGKPASKDVNQFFVQRHGFANYFFNLENRERIWNAFSKRLHLTEQKKIWKATGELHDGKSVDITLRTDDAAINIGDDLTQVDGTLDLSHQTGPQRSGGFSAALYLWHRLLMMGPERFGEVYYLGTAPVPAKEGLYDVLVATHNVIESWFYFDPSNGQLILLEMFPERDIDPCEIYFSEYRDVDGCRLPHCFQVHHGEQAYGTINIDHWKLSSPVNDAT